MLGRRIDVNTPGQYRGIAPDLSNQPVVQSFAEIQWESVFQDEALKQYFISQLALAQAWNTEMQNYVQLYQALGGGWTP